MNTFTFTTNNNNKSSNLFRFPKYKSTNYSKILDNIILSNIKKNNKYITDAILKHDLGTSSIIINDSYKNEFNKAINFLANYKKLSTLNSKFKFGKVYKLIDGTPIVFYNDEVQIGFDVYHYEDFDDFNFINTLSDTTKKTIIEIYTKGYEIKITL
jgi:hypothetical protein